MNPEVRFVELYDALFQRLVVHARHFVEDEETAKDVVSDVFVELWNKMDTIDLEAGIVAYLYRAVTTRSLNVLRHRNVSAVRLELLEAINERRMEFVEQHTALDGAEQSDLRTGINEAIRQLPEKCREAFILSYINGLKNKEIAEAMNVSVRTVEAHIYKALRLMRENLKYLLSLIILLT